MFIERPPADPTVSRDSHSDSVRRDGGRSMISVNKYSDGTVAITVGYSTMNGRALHATFTFASGNDIYAELLADAVRVAIRSELSRQFQYGYNAKTNEVRLRRRRYRLAAKKRRGKK